MASILVATLLLVAGVLSLPLDTPTAACNGNDTKIWEISARAEMGTFMSDCVKQGAPNCTWQDHCIRAFIGDAPSFQGPDSGAACMSDCVHKREALSPSCSDCFGALSQCTFKNCMTPCMLPESDECKACDKQHCLPVFESCSGISDVPEYDTSLSTALSFVANTSQPQAAEQRRWVGSRSCAGNYTVLNSDVMGSCTSFLVPAPASIKVEFKNNTVYSSFHYQYNTQCKLGLFTHDREFLADWVVGTCEDLSIGSDVYSQMRVWLY